MHKARATVRFERTNGGQWALEIIERIYSLSRTTVLAAATVLTNWRQTETGKGQMNDRVLAENRQQSQIEKRERQMNFCAQE